MLQQSLADGPALAFFANEIFFRNFHIGEKYLAERAHPADHLDRPDFDARCIHVHQQERNAAMLVALVRADEAEAFVGPLATTGPGLLAVDDIMIAFIFCKSLQIGEVGSGVRFGITLAPADFTTADRRDMLFFLSLVTIFQQGWAKHHNAHAANRIIGAGLGHFFVQDRSLFAVEAAAAILRRPGGRAPSA